MSTDYSAATDAKPDKSKKRKKHRQSADTLSTKPRRDDEENELAKSAKKEKKHKRRSQNVDSDVAAEIVATTGDSAQRNKKRKSRTGAVSNHHPRPSEDHLETHSPFVTETTSFYLPLSPCAHRFPLEGLCAEHISPLLLTYYPPLNGVLLSYSNPRMSEHPTDAAQAENSHDATELLARSINEYAVTYVWLTADFLLFQPQRGTWLEGYVSLQNESLLGLMCYNYFNAVIPREKLPEDWTWQGEEGRRRAWDVPDENSYFVDARGQKVEGRILFQVDDFEGTPSSDGLGGTVSISGTLRASPGKS